MAMHTIEIDQEVLDYLKSQAEPFTDTPNDVLRRILFAETIGEKPDQFPSKESLSNDLPPVPAGTPKALEQILQVVYLTQIWGVSRSKATRDVANIHGKIAPQTVLDKYCRQLNLKAFEFDKLISEPGLYSLKKVLNAKFNGHGEVINKYLKQLK